MTNSTANPFADLAAAGPWELAAFIDVRRQGSGFSGAYRVTAASDGHAWRLHVQDVEGEPVVDLTDQVGWLDPLTCLVGLLTGRMR